MKTHRLLLIRTLHLSVLCAAALPVSLFAGSTTLSELVTANTYVSSGQPNMNFGTLGAMEIAAPTTAQNRTEETLLGFDTASFESAFNAEYGDGNWAVTSVTLEMFSNVSTAGTQPNNSSFNKIAAGDFELDWLSDDNWSQTGITWNTLPSILPGTDGNTSASLGDFYWPATGDSSATWTLDLDPNLVNDIDEGGEVTILGQPTADSTVGYLINTRGLNGAELNITVDSVPDAGNGAIMLGVALACLKKIKK